MKNKKWICVLAVGILQFSLFAQSNSVLNKDDVNSFDRLIMNPYSKSLDITGTLLAGATIVTPAVLLGAEKSDYWKIGVEYAETMLFAWGAKSIAKYAVERERPYMYFEGAPQNEIDDGDFQNSFFSGHTTLAFAAATFTTFMYTQYFPQSEWTIPVICGSYSLALATGILRIASGNHFATDVICGALVGSAVGFLVPFVNSFWLKPTNSEDVKINLTPASFCVQWNF